MDFSLIAYGFSVYAGVLALTTYAYFGLWEIEADAIPPYLADQGYTPKIFVNQVVDQIDRIRRETATQSQTNVLKGGQATVAGEVASYFGLAGLIRAGQSTLGLEPPRIDIEIVQRDDTAFWRLRGDHALYGPTVRTGDLRIDATDQLFETVAHATIAFMSPFEAAAYDLIADSRVGEYSRTIDATSALLRDCSATVSPICTEANVSLAHTVRGLAHVSAGDVRAAFEDLQEANEAAGGDPVVTVFLGDVVRGLGDEDGARRLYEEAVALDSAVGDRFVRFARGYAEAGNHLLANQRFETAAMLGVDDPEFLAAWGDSLIAVGEFQSALAKYLQAENRDTASDLYGERIDEIREMIDEIEASKTPPAGSDATPGTTTGTGTAAE